MTWRRNATIAAAGLSGTVIGAMFAFVVADLGATQDSRSETESVPARSEPAMGEHLHPPRAPATAPPDIAERGDTGETTLLVWTSGGLPPGFAATVSTHPLVVAHTVVRGDQLDLVRSATADGVTVDAPAAGWHIPLDAIAIDPQSFAPFVADHDRPTVDALQPGAALLTQSSATLRHLGQGDTLELKTGLVTIAGIVDDHSGGGAELVLHAGDADRMGAPTERYLLLRYRPGGREQLARELSETAASVPVRFRSPTETPWLRHGDAVTPPVFVKLAFGEFAYRDRAGRDVEVDPSWVAEHIITAEVPILGSVRCHREMVEPLRSVLTELVDTNLAHLVDPTGFAGCWTPRRISAGQSLSRHAWGVAVDVNIDSNPRGSFSTQDPRLVDLMRSAGFVWGGSWLVPDPGHYELDPP